MDKYNNRIEDFGERKSNLRISNNLLQKDKNKYFKMGGDLNEIIDLDSKSTNELKAIKSKLIMSKNLVEANKGSKELDNIVSNKEVYIREYLSNVVTGKRIEDELEFGSFTSEGDMIISFNELEKMVDSGEYNIIEANYFNDDMIQVKYQQTHNLNSKKF